MANTRRYGIWQESDKMERPVIFFDTRSQIKTPTNIRLAFRRGFRFWYLPSTRGSPSTDSGQTHINKYGSFAVNDYVQE